MLMLRSILLSGIMLCLNLPLMSQDKTLTLRFLETSDVHGCFFPYDFINRGPLPGTLARAATYIDSLRKEYGERLMLFDNGDILQGQPTCYYANYVHPELSNVAAKVSNYLGYDAQVFGNHDVETGHAVYDKWISELRCPVLGANIINTATGLPYVLPYAMYDRDGIRIAVIGMLTPAIPYWLHETLWQGMHFEEMVSSARRWVEVVKKKERADIIIGVFHSGREGGITTPEYEEDATMRIAREVPGFDIIFYGHDHTIHHDIVENVEGKPVLCLNPSAHAHYIADAKLTLTLRKGKIVDRKAEGKLVNIEQMAIHQPFMERFQSDIDSVQNYVDRKIGVSDTTIRSRDAYFGPAAFTDFVHDLQMQITGADISFNAPLVFDAEIKKGDIRVSDMFNLYKYENNIYVLHMTGEEVRRHLEMSYDLWVNTMTSPDDHIMQINEYNFNDLQRYGFKNLAFNFDSAFGIDYEVDVTQPDGSKVRILRMSNGEPFDLLRTYKVVMNSYRGNGGGELLTKGAGISREELPKRILFKSARDQRYYLMQEIEKMGHLHPRAHTNWRFVPEAWAQPALERDRNIIFGEKGLK